MKTTLIITVSILIGIALNGYLDAVHHNLYNRLYDQCKTKLLAEHNFQTQQQAFDCVRTNTTMKILGTLLFQEGSLLEGK